MASLYEILNNAHDGEGMTALGREFGLTPTQTQAAVTALLPAISTGLKQSTATPDAMPSRPPIDSPRPMWRDQRARRRSPIPAVEPFASPHD
jgi:Bacterial protein of unknown function (DUF937)